MLPHYQPQSLLKIFEEILDLESHKPVNISIIDNIIFVKLEAKDKSATGPRCGCKSHKLHQNHEHLVQYLPWNEKAVYLQVNSRQFKCDKCSKPFTETLEIKSFRQAYTKRLALDIVTRVLSSNILAVAEQTSLSEYQKKVKEMSPILEQMHNLKEEFRNIFEKSQNWGDGTLALMNWIKKASNVYCKSCQTLINWFSEVTGYFEHHISNGCVEGLNNKLKVIKRAGYGYRNFENFELRILLSCTKSIELAY